jgi:SEC-C motif domain protein
MSENIQTCPCGSGSTFDACCEPIIKGTHQPETAEQLMRARYSAFVTGAIDFIVSSTHTRSRNDIDLSFIRDWSQNSTWHALEILETKDVNENKAFVSFEARYTQNGEEQRHREKSLFEREDGEWRFVTGDELKNPTVRYETAKPGRNEPCPCGSGKKYKKCHGA